MRWLQCWCVGCLLPLPDSSHPDCPRVWWIFRAVVSSAVPPQCSIPYRESKKESLSVSAVEIRLPAKALGHPSRLAPINLDFPIHFGWHWINDMFDEREKPSVNTSIICQLPLTLVWFHFEAGASDTLKRVSLREMMAALLKKICYLLLSCTPKKLKQRYFE